MKPYMSRVTSALALLIGALMASPAFASTINQGDAFYSFYQTMNQWVGGALGTGLAVTSLLLGGAVGVAKNSPMPALSGVAMAAFLHWGPTIITQIMASGAVF
ncbi:MAG: TraA family conjugative transfer protein [Terriglobia bacterium]|nr:TraA family conjugative transfer protein [Terriglobia bacterium]